LVELLVGLFALLIAALGAEDKGAALAVHDILTEDRDRKRKED
jgi:hypothetical protein